MPDAAADPLAMPLASTVAVGVGTAALTTGESSYVPCSPVASTLWRSARFCGIAADQT